MSGKIDIGHAFQSQALCYRSGVGGARELDDAALRPSAETEGPDELEKDGMLHHHRLLPLRLGALTRTKEQDTLPFESRGLLGRHQVRRLEAESFPWAKTMTRVQ